MTTKTKNPIQKILIFDTETTTDETQRFKFGFYQWGEWDGLEFTCLNEGLFYDDSFLSADDILTIREFYAREIREAADVSGVFELITLREFRDRYLWKRCYKERGTLVGFNLPFDVSRIALAVGEARKERFRGGFSYTMWEMADGKPNFYRPRLMVRMLDSKKSFMEWSTTSRDSTGFNGSFIDLRTLAFALTNLGLSLASACTLFNVTHAKLETDEHGFITDDYLRYARRDVVASTELLTVLLRRFAEHPVSIRPDKTFSPASLSKAYFREMGIPQPLDRQSISDEILGYCMTAFYGARSECRIRRLSVPVALCDFTSMYPTVNALMGNWEFLTASEIWAREATEDVRTFLHSVDLESCFRKHTWERFRGIVRIRPTEDIVPVRSRYGKASWNIGVNYYTSDEPQWFAIPDIVASILLTGKVPEIDAAYVFEHSSERVAGLRSVAFSGRVQFDPTEDDFFRFVVDERAKYGSGTIEREFLKVLANAGCYGVFAEINKETTNEPDDIWLFGGESWISTSRDIERPGPYSYPPISTCITAAARLMLAMLERCVTDYHGRWAFTDTDSMAIVADTNAENLTGDFAVLSHAQVDSIRHRFDSLNPYANVADLLKLEYTGDCYAISSKRYCLYTTQRTGGINIAKYSSHGLGHLISPTYRNNGEPHDWIAETWRYILDRGDKPEWLDQPAISRYSVTQYSLLQSFRKFNHGRNYDDRVKPSNFIIVAHGSKFQPTVAGHHVPIRSYEPDSTKWLDRQWISKNDGRFLTLGVFNDTTGIENDVYYVKSYRDVIEGYAVHSEDKFATTDGAPCYPTYVGMLERVHVRAVGTVYLGKESNNLEQVQLGLVSAHEETLTYETNTWRIMHPLLAQVFEPQNNVELARMTGVARKTIIGMRQGKQPSKDSIRKIVRAACLIACDELGHVYHETDDPVETLTKWKDRTF